MSISVVLTFAFAVAAPASQPEVGDWVAPVREALAPYSEAAPLHDHVESVSVTLADNSIMTLRWSASAQLFVQMLSIIEASAEVVGDGYDRSTGLNRFTQHLAGGQIRAVEHWADTDGNYRFVMVNSASQEIAENWLVAFETYRRAGGFGGWPSLTPPLTTP